MGCRKKQENQARCHTQSAYMITAMDHELHPCSRPASSLLDRPISGRRPEPDPAMTRLPDSGSGLGSNPPGSIGIASRPATTKLLLEPPTRVAQRELSITPFRKNPCGN